MKQTAVEYLWGRLFEIKKTIPFDDQTEAILNAYHEAKQMEISQESEVYLKGFEDGVNFQIKLDKFTFKSE